MLHGLQRHAFSGLVGFAGGASVGLVGWGGAQFIIPGLTHPLMGHTQLAATGVSICSLSTSSVTSAFKFVWSDSVSYSHAISIGVPAILAARIGTRLATRLPDDVHQLAFNAASFILVPLNLIVQQNAASKRDASDEGGTLRRTLTAHMNDRGLASLTPDPAPARLVATAASVLQPCDLAFGVLTGAISAILGVGGLPLTMSYLTAFTDLPHHLVQGTAMLAVAPSIVTSALTRLDAVPKVTAAAVTVGAMVGAAAGASVALRTSEARLRELYMLSLAVLGGRSFVSAGHNLRSILAKQKPRR